MKAGKDLEMLTALAELRLASTSQLAAWLAGSERIVRRRAGKLVELGLAESLPRVPARGRGRPQWTYSTTCRGVAALQESGVLPATVPTERVTAEALLRMTEHQLLLNDIAVQCRELGRADSGFQVRFIASTSPFHLSGAGGTVLADQVEFADGQRLSFVPDAAFSISHEGVDRSVLFFVEVDTGTETVEDPNGPCDGDVRGKVVVYRTYLGRGGYRRYQAESFFKRPFLGFRLLLICASPQRARTVSRMVAQNPPSAFFWVAAAVDLRREGLGARVWRRGGNLDEPGRSILGSLAPPAIPSQVDLARSERV